MISLQSILERRSQPLMTGEIDKHALHQILCCALTAPDHRRLRPWRYILCNPEHKEALIQLIASSLPATSEDLVANQLEQVRKKLSFAPHIVICVLDINRESNVPEVEQVLSAGAAIQNMIIAAESLNYRCYWKTGAWAYDLRLRENLNLGADTLITAFLGFGRAADSRGVAKSAERPAYADHFISVDQLMTPTHLLEVLENRTSQL
ncbi:nitroreductase [Enterobacterales bacterium AE_CKDN230030158-1A_HGKHYDSX7]